MVVDGRVKIIFTGESGTGKSSIIQAIDPRQKSRETVGIDLCIESVNIDGRDIPLEIWDTCGQERFQAFTQSYYHGAYGAVLVYDISDRRSFMRVESWLSQIKMLTTIDNIVIILVGNKIDMDAREVSREEGLAFAKQHNILFIETSALKNKYVGHMLEKLTRKILKTHHIPVNEPLKTITLGKSSEPEKSQSGGCC